MTLNVPDKVFETYTDGMNLFFDKFGVICTLVFLRNKVSIVPIPDIHNKLVQNPFGPVGAKRGNEQIIQEEITEDFTLRVYYDKKTIKHISKLEIPSTSCMTIGPESFMDKAKKCSYMKIKETKYERVSTPEVWGLDGKYTMCLWSEV